MTPSTPARRIGAVVLLRDDGAVLMQLRDDKPGLPRAGMWVMPGGHCEPDESAGACARREFREETDYDCADLRLLGRYDDYDETSDSRFDLHVYWSTYDGRGSFRCLEGQDLQFIPRSDAEHLAVPRLLLEVWDATLKLAAQENLINPWPSAAPGPTALEHDLRRSNDERDRTTSNVAKHHRPLESPREHDR